MLSSMKHDFFKYIIFSLCLLFIGTSDASQHYFLCGPDEDGCYPGEYPYCLCMPYDGALASQPYCLNFDNISCVPLSLMPNCPHVDIFNNQSDCLATAFQSEPDPPCPLKTKAFCIKHHVPLCPPDGGEDSCH